MHSDRRITRLCFLGREGSMTGNSDQSQMWGQGFGPARRAEERRLGALR